MSQKTITILKATLITTLVVVSSQVFAVWNPPSGTPPSGNTAIPINVSADLQTKAGSFIANGMRTAGATGVLIVDSDLTMTGTYNGGGVFDASASNGTFKTSKGTVTLMGNTVLDKGKTLALSGGTSGTLTLQVPATVTTYALTLPSAQGANDTYLKNNGSGVLTWSTGGGGPGTGTTNLIPKWNATGDALIDSVVRDVAGYVGISTTTPQSKLSIDGGVAIGSTYSGTKAAANGNLIVENKVGINTDTPAYPLDVLGNVKLKGSLLIGGNSSGLITFAPQSASGTYTLTLPNALPTSTKFLQSDNTGALSWASASGGPGTGTAHKLPKWDATGTALTDSALYEKLATGDIGINTTNPGSKLGVLGNLSLGATYATIAAPASGAIIEGNVGIGVSSVSYKFQVLGESRFVGSGGGYALTAMSGNVGIGSNAPLELLSVGNNVNGNYGVMSLSNAVSGRVIIQPQASSFTTYTLTLPGDDGTANQVLTTNGTGTLTWTTPAPGGGVTTVGTIDTQTKSSNGLVISGVSIYAQTADISNPGLMSTTTQTFAGNKTFNGTLSVGNTFTQTGANTFSTGTGAVSINGNTTLAVGKTLTLSGATSGTVTFQPAASTTTHTITWPDTAGTNGYALTTNGSGTLSWTPMGGADNLGNHIATTSLQMSGNTINGHTASGGNLTLESTTHTTKGSIVALSNLQMSGKTIYGNSSATTDLTLDSTSNGTFKGNVILNPINGNVGINITSPLTKLDVGGAVGTTLGSASVPTHTFRTDLNTGMFSPSADTIAFTVGGVEKVRILTGGDMTINGALAGLGGGFVSTNATFGPSALDSNTSGSQNAAFGYNALTSNTGTSNNTAFGAYALQLAVGGSFNTAIGRGAMYSQDSSGSSHTAVGANALVNMFGTQNGNTAIGYGTLASITTSGGYNTGLGYGANVINGANNSTAIGYNATANVSNLMMFGGTNASDTPSSKVLDWGFGAVPASGRALQVGVDTTNGNGAYLTEAGVWSSGSDRSKKHNISGLQYGLSTIMQLRPVQFDWNGSNQHDIGFIAQEVKPIIPEIVNGVDGNMGIGYSHFAPVVVNAIQELKKENDELKARIEALELKLK